MDIHLQRGLYIGMTQNFRQGVDIHTAFNAACSEGMPENVIISEWQVVLLKEAPEKVLHCPRLQRPLCAGKQAAILLVLHLAQYGKHFRRQRNSANGVFAFRRLQHQLGALSVVDAVNRPLATKYPFRKVNIRLA